MAKAVMIDGRWIKIKVLNRIYWRPIGYSTESSAIVESTSSKEALVHCILEQGRNVKGGTTAAMFLKSIHRVDVVDINELLTHPIESVRELAVTHYELARLESLVRQR